MASHSRERKMAMGRKNTPLVTGGGLDAGNSSVSSYSSSHSIVVPVGHKQTIPALEKRRKIVDTSTWMPGMVYNRDFQTVTGASYVDPSSCSIGQDVHEAQIEEAQQEWEKARSVQRRDARDKLAGLAKSKFGNMSNMLKAFKKGTGDTITIVELAEHLRRRNLDVLLSQEDQDLIFEGLHSTARGSVGVGALLKAVDDGSESTDNSKDREMMEMRNFLAEQLAAKRAEEEARKKQDLQNQSLKSLGRVEGGVSPQVTGKEESKADVLMKKAIGQKTFDLEIGAEEMNSMVEDMYSKQHTNQSHTKFARYLRLTNLKLHAIPFYDMRSEEVARLKDRVATLHKTISSDEVSGRLKTLKDTRRAQIEVDLRNSKLAHSTSSTSLISTSNASSSSQMMMSHSSSAPLLQTNEGVHVARNLAGQADSSMSLDTSAPAPESPQTQPRRFTVQPSPIAYNRSSSGVDANDFSPIGKVSTSTVSSIVLSNLNNPADRQSHAVGGKRLLNREVTDWSKIGHGGDCIDTESIAESIASQKNGTAMSPDHGLGRYQTTYGLYYPPLNYEPSQPITRDLVSDADIRYKKKEQKRKSRYERMQANLSVTKDRLECEALDREVRSLRKSQIFNEDLMRYQTTVFLNDMKCYKKQPLQMMAKKPNLTKSDKMWGGHNRFDKRQDDRHFETTYQNSYVHQDSGGEPLNLNASIVEKRIRNMGLQ